MIRKLTPLAVASFCTVAGANSAHAQAATPVVITQHTEAAMAAAVEMPKQVVINIGAGGTLSSGNTQSIAANAGGQLAYRKSRHQIGLEVLGTVGFADDPSDQKTDYERNSGGVIGRGRYDLFLSANDALFLAVQPRRDVNAGLNLRLQNQAGYLRNLYTTGDDHRLWTEAGYDLTYDNFSRLTTTTVTDITGDVDPDDTMDEDGVMGTVTRTTSRDVKPAPEIVHSARLFFGYVNRLNAVATASLGVETLLEPRDLHNVRVNALADLTSSLTARFKLGIQFRALFDNVPVAGKEKLDTITALQLIYNYDSLTPAAPAAPPCDCTADVAAAEAACAERFVCPPVPAPEPTVPVAEAPGETPVGPATSSAAELPIGDATAPAAQPTSAPEVPAAP
jgi:hypothetical protein